MNCVLLITRVNGRTFFPFSTCCSHESIADLDEIFSFRRSYRSPNKLEEYVEADDKKSTRLSIEAHNRINQYPDEDLYFYLPSTQDAAKAALIQEKSFFGYVEALKWLLERDERMEVLLLLYRGTEFTSLHFQALKFGMLSVLADMMELPRTVRAAPHGWMPTLEDDCPEQAKEKIKESEWTGDLVSACNKADYLAFRMEYMQKAKLDKDNPREYPWRLTDPLS